MIQGGSLTNGLTVKARTGLGEHLTQRVYSLISVEQAKMDPLALTPRGICHIGL